MASEAYDEIVRFLREEQGIPPEKLTPNTRILHDLRVYGVDAAELLDYLRARFGTDFSAIEQNWTEYFHHEVMTFSAGWLFGSLALAMLWSLFLTWIDAPVSLFPLSILAVVAILAVVMIVRPKKEMTPITIADLAAAVEAGAWSKQPANSDPH